MRYPRLIRVRQRLEGPAVPDVSAAVREAVRTLPLRARVRAGQAVAVTAGSRGVANIAAITRAVVDELKALRLAPFIVPAMGSHGGATAEGQAQLLQHYGITEAGVGCPIRSSMAVAEIGRTKGTTVFCDKHAWEADHIVVVGRIAPHPDFSGDIESGLFKMMAIGLGKQHGAEAYHRAGQHYSYAEIFPLVGRTVLNTGHVLFGLGVVENGSGQTAKVRAVLPDDFEAVERALLREAKAWKARLPFEAIDLLVVDEMGKDINGAGMDPHVIGRPTIQKPAGTPHVRHLFVRDLTPESQGNAIGIGFADLTTWRLVRAIDYRVMYMNGLTSSDTHDSKVPMAFDSDREAIEAALGMNGLTPPERARVVRIKNTLRLTEIDVSESLLPDVRTNDRLSAVSDPAAPAFDALGNLPPF
ncbi:MAG: lactate racemase domain-containing protein [Candidatus Methylomirabilales bacterium]